MRFRADLHNSQHFLSLRADPHAQYEIRLCRGNARHARALAADDPRRFSRILDECGADFRGRPLGDLLAGEQVEFETSSLSRGKWRELMTVLARPAA
jgi:thymidylate synthase (FAD)